MSITKETRRQSYDEVMETLGERHRLILSHLEGEHTANELAMSMWQKGLIKTPDRNMVHPRLNELVEDQLVQVVDKRTCSISGRLCAVYKVVDVIKEDG